MRLDSDGDGEWFAAEPDAPAADDVLDLGPDRPSGLIAQQWADRWNRVSPAARWGLALAACAVTAGGYLVVHALPSHPAVAVASTDPSAAESRFANDQTVDMVAATARDLQPLTDFIRSDAAPGDCAQVRIGTMPQNILAAAIGKALPHYAVRDVARTLDQYTGLCTIVLRARDNRGSTLVAKVSSASHGRRNEFDHVTVASRSDGNAVVSIVSNLTRTGWTVTVGAVGPVSDQPSSEVMLELAQNPALLW